MGILLLTGIFTLPEISLPVFYNSGYFSTNEDVGLFKNIEIDFFQNLFGILIIIGGVLVGYSKEKIEDEYISSLRLRSVFWSLMVTYSIILILFLTLFGILFFTAMIIIIFLPLILYIFRFNYLLLKK
ncbi:hypothetical protein [Chryseobacterium polytrichastri]|uniref:Uncharacterized protein n=1 Tax=Chryseobacterium polytrichastri TaxID=1302687 RepID=A0A1M6U7C1_9FLAO|nr:hypothetical protein [Chryseobacterium polytrichastri]SHK65175.1 hypothetical protein SAMN05444267_100672 [Chryseobacterium polytrichastri]